MITFRIHYTTAWGENLFVCGNTKSLGEWQTERACKLSYQGNGLWSIDKEVNNLSNIEYKYFIKDINNNIRWEDGQNRFLEIPQNLDLVVYDYWQKRNIDVIFEQKPFREVFFNGNTTNEKTQNIQPNGLRLQVKIPRISSDLVVAISGNQQALGSWHPNLCSPMIQNENHQWYLDIPLKNIHFPIIYKYVVFDQQNKRVMEWEEGNERRIDPLIVPKNTSIIQNDYNFRHQVENWKAAGVAIPVFSLRSEKSFGVGEFNDLLQLVDWSKKTGLKVIQVLPINETVATHSWLDSYPYKSISTLALHPMYLNLEEMGINEVLKDVKTFNKVKKVLNGTQTVDYVEVTKQKSKYYKILFDAHWSKLASEKDFKTFFKENRNWLEPYAAFCYLRDWYQTSNFNLWEEWATYDLEKIKKLVDPKKKYYEHIAIHYYLQYHLDKQLKKVVKYAHDNNIALKGDIPIGISPYSIEAWTEPHLFNLNGQAGAPPDDFAVLGQNWGFPTYNWEEMAKDGYQWWQNRLKMMAKYFDAYRIDHILGFFRIWEIPKHASHGLQGYFRPGLPFTIDELEEREIWFDSERFTKPYIREHMLHDFFGDHAQLVKKHFLTETTEYCYAIKEKFNTQAKIIEFFNGNSGSLPKDIFDGLLSLLNEVIFIRDPYEKHLAYHPRITFQYTYSFRELDESLKHKLNEIYVDYFYKRHNQFWKDEAMKTLPAITNATKMLVCGEDLGMVPDCVPEVMDQLNILSLEIQRMPKNPKNEFLHPNDAPYLSVCTTSTHDMSTIRGWWEEDREKTQRFFHSILGHNGDAPFFAEPWVCREIIVQHLYSPAMLTIFPLQDLLAMDGNIRWDKTEQERINLPSNPENKWCYRMNLTLNDLLKEDEFNEELFQLIKQSNRNSKY